MGGDTVKCMTGTISWRCPRWQLCQAGGSVARSISQDAMGAYFGSHDSLRSVHHVIVDHPHPQPTTDTHSVSVFHAKTVPSVHSNGEETQVEEAKPGKDGYWPAFYETKKTLKEKGGRRGVLDSA